MHIQTHVYTNNNTTTLFLQEIFSIAKDIKESHRRDAETGDENNPLTDVIDVVKEFAMATDPMKATLSTLSKQLGMNFNKMDPAEVQFFTTLVEKYSTTYRSMLPKKGVAKNSDFQSRSSSAHADVPGDWGSPQQADAGFVWTQTLLANLHRGPEMHYLRD